MPNDATIREEPTADEKWSQSFPQKPTGPPYTRKNFELEVNLDEWKIPRNGNTKAIIKNPTAKWQEVRVAGKEGVMDFWFNEGHMGVHRFVLAPNESKEVPMGHGDKDRGENRDREVEITHARLPNEAKAETLKKAHLADRPERKIVYNEYAYDEYNEITTVTSFPQNLSAPFTGSITFILQVIPNEDPLVKEPQKEPHDPICDTKQASPAQTVQTTATKKKKCCVIL